MDEQSYWWLQEIPYFSCSRPWCYYTCNVNIVVFLILFLNFRFKMHCCVFFNYVFFLLVKTLFPCRSLIGLVGAWKNNSILLWIVSFDFVFVNEGLGLILLVMMLWGFLDLCSFISIWYFYVWSLWQFWSSPYWRKCLFPEHFVSMFILN